MVSNYEGEKARSKIELNDQTFEVQSPVCEHGWHLKKAVKDKKLPKMPHIQLFVDNMKKSDKMRRDLQRQTNYLNMMIAPDVVIAACVAVCAACALDFVFACFQC